MSKAMGRISLSGDISVDLINEAGKFVPYPGGSAFNVALTLKKMGADIDFFSIIGNDYWGNYLEKFLTNNHITTDKIFKTDKIKTSLAFAVVDQEGNSTYDFYKMRSDVVLDNVDLSTTSFFHFGSSFSISKYPRKSVKKLLSEAKKNNCIISYDPNYRKSLSDNLIVKIRKNIKNSHIVKASIDDFNAIFHTTDIEEIKRIIKGYSSVVLFFVTKGSKGAFVYNVKDDLMLEVDGISREVVNTIGAGDSFMAACLFYLYKNRIDTLDKLKNIGRERLSKLLNFANRCASESVSHHESVVSQDFIENAIKEI